MKRVTFKKLNKSFFKFVLKLKRIGKKTGKAFLFIFRKMRKKALAYFKKIEKKLTKRFLASFKKLSWKKLSPLTSGITIAVLVLQLFAPVITFAGVGDIDLSNVQHIGSNIYSASGSWNPTNKCYTNGKGFRYYIYLYDDLNNNSRLDTGEKLTEIIPASCSGEFVAPVSDTDNGGIWPAIGQPGGTFNLGIGNHKICSVLMHINDNGNDTAASTNCYGQDQEGGTISGYKYEDLDNNKFTDEYLQHPLQNWTIKLLNDQQQVIDTATTDSEGYYEFTDVAPGAYNLEETAQTGWTQLDSPGLINLNYGELVTEQNFINYQSFCGNSILDDYEQCDDGSSGSSDCTTDCKIIEPITYGWVISEWDSCSASCGGGTQARDVVCQDNNQNVVDDTLCIETKPDISQSCNTQVCTTYDWVENNWGTCSADCGGGTQARDVVCQDNNQNVVDDTLCIETKPDISQSCNTQVCTTYDWVENNWGTCSADCGGGTQARDVVCQDNNQNVVDDTLCIETKPDISQSCNNQTCGGGNTITIDPGIVKTVDNENPVPGSTIIYTLTVTNIGNTEATGVVVTDTLPSGVTYVSDNAADDADTTFDAGILTWNIASLAASAIATLEITATVNSDASGSIVNTASVTTEGDSNDNNDSDTAGLNVQVPESTTPPPSGGGGGGGGGGSSLPLTLMIMDVYVTDVTQTTATISWRTNYESTSQVLYAGPDEAHILNMNDNTGTPPLYGYAHTTSEDTNKVTYHTVTITGLTPNTPYYFMAVSHGSLAFSQEGDFTTLALVSVSGEVLGVKIEAPEPTPELIVEPKVLGLKVLPATGFNVNELLMLILAFTSLIALQFASKKYILVNSNR